MKDAEEEKIEMKGEKKSQDSFLPLIKLFLMDLFRKARNLPCLFSYMFANLI